MNGKQEVSRCSRYRMDVVRNLSNQGYIPGSDINLTDLEQEDCADGWSYSRNIYRSTVVTEASSNLFCFFFFASCIFLLCLFIFSCKCIVYWSSFVLPSPHNALDMLSCSLPYCGIWVCPTVFSFHNIKTTLYQHTLFLDIAQRMDCGKITSLNIFGGECHTCDITCMFTCAVFSNTDYYSGLENKGRTYQKILLNTS